MVIVLGLIAVLSVLIVVFVRRKKAIDLRFTCADGNFRIKGRKQKLKIYKGNRFVFNVVDGQVVSFVDKSISNKPVIYKGVDYGNT